MMFHTTNSPLDFKPCEDECRYKGPRDLSDSLCIKCGMTEAEKAEWLSMGFEERYMLSYEVGDRMQCAWMLWEIMEEPTLQ